MLWREEDEEIYFYGGPLSAFASTPISISGVTWPSAAHFYYGQKTLDENLREEIRRSVTPVEARKLGKSLKLRPQWEEMKFDIMLVAFRAKFSQHESCKQFLLATGHKKLYEERPYKSDWGHSNGGRNLTGNALSTIREHLLLNQVGHGEKLLLMGDLSNLVARYWFARPAGTFELGSNHGAEGAFNVMQKTMETYNPTDILVAADTRKEEGMRREVDATYKAERKPMDPDLVEQIQKAAQMFRDAGWPVVTATRHEADDVLATMAKTFPGKVLITTGDKDLLATCSDQVSVLLMRGGGQIRLCGPSECKEIMGVGPELVCYLKALEGDNSDGIKGVPGIGRKSAVFLLTKFKSIDEIYEGLDQIPSRIRKKLEGQKEAAETSLKLALLCDELDIEAGWNSVGISAKTVPSLPTTKEVKSEVSKDFYQLSFGDL
jgi:ribA/ribD-fused uncharacterized protein